MTPSSTPPPPDDAFQAIVLAGGRAERLGRIDKTALARAGRTLLREAVDASSAGEPVVVVGARNRTGGLSDTHEGLTRRATFVDERPAHGGPVPGVAAGLAAARADRRAHGLPTPAWTLLLSADLPHAVVASRRLRAHRRPEHAAVIATDSGGRLQPLLALYRTRRLAAAIDAVAERRALAGAPLRDVVRALDPDGIRLVELPDGLCADIDTWGDAIASGYELQASGPIGIEGAHAS